MMGDGHKPRPKAKPGAYIEVSWPGGGIGQEYFEVDRSSQEPVVEEKEEDTHERKDG
jgi:hypothetical protein